MRDRVYKIIKKLSDVHACKDNMKLVGDIGLDSLLLVTMLIEIEDEFEIELNESDMNPYELETIGDVIAMVGRYAGDGNG